MASNLVIINGSNSLRWIVHDREMGEVIDMLDRFGRRVPASTMPIITGQFDGPEDLRIHPTEETKEKEVEMSKPKVVRDKVDLLHKKVDELVGEVLALEEDLSWVLFPTAGSEDSKTEAPNPITLYAHLDYVIERVAHAIEKLKGIRKRLTV